MPLNHSKLAVALVIFLFLLLSKTSSAQGQLWGTTYYGGSNTIGTIYKINTDGTGYEVQHNFKTDESGAFPYSFLTEAGNGKLYGTTPEGGANGVGVLFEYDKVSGTFTKKFDFSEADGSNPDRELTLAPNGKLYGSTLQGGTDGPLGVIFEYDPINNIYTKKSEALGSVSFTLTSDGKLLGLSGVEGANGAGMIFEYDPTNNTLTPKFSFSPSDGSYPRGKLLEASNGKFYGTTTSGGEYNKGTIFEYDPGTETCTKLFDFEDEVTGTNPSGDLIEVTSGKLLGLTPDQGGSIFEFDYLNNQLTKKFNFSQAGLFDALGSLTITSTNKIYVLSSPALVEYDYQNNTIIIKKYLDTPFGGGPNGFLTEASNGKLYGTSRDGGVHRSGALFEFDPITEIFSTKYDFSVAEKGGWPRGGLTLANNGKFYGLTSVGGDKHQGVLFEFNPSTKAYSVIVSLNFNVNGGYPHEGLTAASNGKLYGVTTSGGIQNGNGPTQSYGTLFEYDPSNNVFSIKHYFTNPNEGGFPHSRLTEATNGKLYGVTGFGGSGSGVLYEYDPESETYTKKFDFPPQVGGSQVHALVEANPGKLYGTTFSGGSNNMGTIFEYDLVQNTYNTVFEFPADFGHPLGDFIKTSTGSLVGSTTGGGDFSSGGIYEYHLSTGVFSERWSFNDSFFYDNRSLTENGGKLYGTVSEVGNHFFGTVFEFDLLTNNYHELFDFPNNAGMTWLEPDLQSQVITFNALSDKTFEDEPFELTATASSNLPVTYFSIDPEVATVNGNIVTIHGAGVTTITAIQSGSSIYSAAHYVRQVLTVHKAEQTITFSALPIKKFGDATFDLGATSSSHLEISYTSSDPSVATINGNTVTIVGLGSTTITATQNGNINYESATQVEQSFTVNKAEQTITFSELPTKIFGDASFNLAAFSSSQLEISYSSSNPSVATISGNTVTIVGAGSTTITATQNGNINYESATQVEQSFTVNKAEQTITFSELPTKIFGDASFNLAAFSSSQLEISYSSSNPSVATISGNTVTIVGAGSTTITATQNGNVNYESATQVERSFNVNKASQTLSFNSISNKIIGSAPFVLGATSSAGFIVQYHTTSDKVSMSGAQVTLLNAGSVTIEAFQSGTNNYNQALPVSQTFCINPAKPSITSTGDMIEPLLTSSASIGNQWYLNSTAIPNAINASYEPIETGVYSVKVTIDNCSSSFSDDFAIVITGFEKPVTHASLKIYPNPALHEVVIDLSEFDESLVVNLVVIDFLGKLKLTQQVYGGTDIRLDISNFPKGQYILKAEIQQQIRYNKFVKR